MNKKWIVHNFFWFLKKDPVVGEEWIYDSDYKNPFKRKMVTVVDIKDRYVKYKLEKFGIEHSSSINSFKMCHIKL